MDLFIPPRLIHQARQSGDAGVAWLDSLPARITELERTWGFRTGPGFDHGGAVSWVAPVELDAGGEAVVKIGLPHDEARFESDALRLLDGQGAVRLLCASDDGFSLLLERCQPGTDLWATPEDERDAVASRILPRLWRPLGPEAPFRSLADLVAAWCAEVPASANVRGYDQAMVDQALDLGRELAASQPRSVFLHGDFHPANVLAAEREPWLVIDPKPFAGDPAFDLAQWLLNHYYLAARSTDSVGTVQRQIARFADALDLSPARIAGWTFVKALCWDWPLEIVALFQQVARQYV